MKGVYETEEYRYYSPPSAMDTIEDTDSRNSIEIIIEQLNRILKKNWSCPKCKRLYQKQNIQLHRKKICVQCILHYQTHVQLHNKISRNFTMLNTLNL